METTFTKYDILDVNGNIIYQAILNDNDPNLIHNEWLCNKMDNLSWDKGIDRNTLYYEIV
jgi:hypothetical protein